MVVPYPVSRLTRRHVLARSASLALVTLLAACSTRQPVATISPTATPLAPSSPTPQPPLATATVVPTIVPRPRIDLSPSPALVDTLVSLRLIGFPPGQNVMLAATIPVAGAGVYRSSASFRADAQGAIDVATQAPLPDTTHDPQPLSATYNAPDAMGLFWSMALTPDANVPAISSRVYAVPPPWTMAFTASVAGTMVASATIERRFVDPAVTRIPIRDQGLVGTLFLPGDPGAHPGVLTWGGSSGGYAESQAALLASHGFAALALAYFGVPPLPDNLLNIPLEYVATAIAWMQAQTGVDGARLAALGTSRGGELALLVGATFPQIRAVVGYVPSGLLWPGNDNTGRHQPGPAWTYQGMPLPYVTTATSYFGTRYADPTDLARATIPVERINGPVLLISGEDDALWPSTELAQRVMDRLAQYHHPYPDQHLHYAGAGHSIGQPYRPTTALASGFNPTIGATENDGGNAKGYAAAIADSWPKVLAFLHDSLTM